ncbi:hypothetical protein GGF50DRAFT_13863, partial [Schizophyllum commune]
WAVYVGRETGVFTSWCACKAQVLGVPHSSCKGYLSRDAAESAYSAARASGLTFACGLGTITVHPVLARMRLTLEDLPICLAFVDDETSLKMANSERRPTWYVVYCGTQPGIYLTNHEVLLATTGMSGARHSRYRTREEAERAFKEGLRRGRVFKFIL